jgi:GNAT superfamily N-acetyltransferase
MTTLMATIVSLKDYPEYVDIVSKWCFAEWPEENADCGIDSQAKYAQDLVENYIHTDAAWPTVLLAVLPSGECCGTVALDPQDMSSKRPNVSPWLASLFVPPQFRRRGIALQLVRGVQNVVRTLADVNVIYLWSDVGKHQTVMYERCGFIEMERLHYCGNLVAIMKWSSDDDLDIVKSSRECAANGRECARPEAAPRRQ